MLTTALLIWKLLTTPDSGSEIIKQISDSGRCVELAESPDERVERLEQIAPGKPPVLSFRLYESKARYGNGSSGLMLDDAGH